MSIKKYLTTPEEILALKDTDTKIYDYYKDKYYKFVDGVLCYFNDKDEILLFNTNLVLGSLNDSYPYILIEKSEEEATEKDIGKLCCFWDFHKEDKRIGVLMKVDADSCPYYNGYTYYSHCRCLTPTEVAEITGYKVEE